MLEGRVSEIREAGVRAVVYESLDPPDDAKPGAAGHAGLEGHDESKVTYKDRRARVALCLRLIAWGEPE